MWDNGTFKLIYNNKYKDGEKCLKILHDFTDSVIKDRKAEYKLVYDKILLLLVTEPILK